MASNYQEWNQTEYWTFPDGRRVLVAHLSKRELLQIGYATHMLVSKHPKTIWVYQSKLWDAVMKRQKFLFDTYTRPSARSARYTPRVFS